MTLQGLDEEQTGDRGDRGERVLLDVRETREQERRLREIQQQLQVLDETERSDVSVGANITNTQSEKSKVVFYVVS